VLALVEDAHHGLAGQRPGCAEAGGEWSHSIWPDALSIAAPAVLADNASENAAAATAIAVILNLVMRSPGGVAPAPRGPPHWIMGAARPKYNATRPDLVQQADPPREQRRWRKRRGSSGHAE
jgi:hypothetical protein